MSSREWHSPSDLLLFVSSPWASWIERTTQELLSKEETAERGRALLNRADGADPLMRMLGRRGEDEEAAVLRSLFINSGFNVTDLSACARLPMPQRVAATANAMAHGAHVIYQAPLADDGFYGVADFLVRTDLLDGAREGEPMWGSSADSNDALVSHTHETSAGAGAQKEGMHARMHEYTVWDAKLARHARPEQLVQLCCYAEMLSSLQGGLMPKNVALVLGGARAQLVRVPLADRLAYCRSLRSRFLAFHRDFDLNGTPPPIPPRGAPAGRWRSLADSLLERRDDLSLIAGLSRRHALLLKAAGVGSASKLAAAQCIPGLDDSVLARLATQARLQSEARAVAADAPPPHVMLPIRRAKGLALLPKPDDADVFFDLEGFPFADSSDPPGSPKSAPTPPSFGATSPSAPRPFKSVAVEATALESAGGREYLWGAALRADSGGAGGYLSWWAHSHEQERLALEQFVDWLTARREAAPGMHVYHYGAYEVSALRRLAMRHATREEQVDDLLRSSIFVDLYSVVRGALQLGAKSYSIKDVEKLYGGARGLLNADDAQLLNDASASVGGGGDGGGGVGGGGGGGGGGRGRGTAVGKGDDSIAAYAAWLDAPDGETPHSSATLSALLEYNRDDCISTLRLADWLWQRRVEAEAAMDEKELGALATADFSFADVEETVETAEGGDEEVRALHDLLGSSSGWEDHGVLNDGTARETLRQLLYFHKREAKPLWWRHFEWLSALPEDLVQDPRTLGGLTRTDRAPFKTKPKKRRLAYEYTADKTQECRIADGSSVSLRSDVVPALGLADDSANDSANDSATETVVLDDRPLSATLHSWSSISGICVVESGAEPARQISILPNEFVNPAPISAALLRAARRLVDEPLAGSALADFLSRRPSAALAEARRLDGGGSDGAALVTAAAMRLSRSYLCVQGPPGSGKTYAGAQAILALVRSGQRVGITAHSHAAILNLMRSALQLLAREGVSARAVKIGGDKLATERLRKTLQTMAEPKGAVKLSHCLTASALTKSSKGVPEDVLIVGATAWGFCHESMADSVQTLFIDEAGQVPLANLVGVSEAADSFVLLGDHMQLPAPIEGSHPARSGDSCLEYLLRGEHCVPSDLGIFLRFSYRMHPELCDLVSEMSYQSNLKPHPSAQSRKLILPTARAQEKEVELPTQNQEVELPTQNQGAEARASRIVVKDGGVQFIQVAHDGNTQSSKEEADFVSEICKQLRASFFEDCDGTRPIEWEDILIVAPYNAQVRLISSKLPPSARVGTVDRFQGQEALVVIVSCCHSDFSDEATASGAADAPVHLSDGARGLSFVLNRNRLNVALSRAQCLAIVLASPTLAEAKPKSLSQQRELNYFCRIREVGEGQRVGAQAAASKPRTGKAQSKKDWQ